MLGADDTVRLIVYDWDGVQPGTLSWLFPSVREALAAAFALKNAERWMIVRSEGGHEASAQELRERGVVVLESVTY
jgi:hypothetical protein